MLLVLLSAPPAAGAPSYTIGEIATVITPVVIALALVAWFFIQKWLSTYQTAHDQKVDDIKKKVDEAVAKLSGWEEKTRDHERQMLLECNRRHEDVVRREDYERDRTILQEQGKTILAKVEDIREVVERE